MAYQIAMIFTISRAVPMWATPEYIQEQAHVLSAQRFQNEFVDVFLPQYQRGNGQENLLYHSLKAAEYIMDVFTSVWHTIGQAAKIPKGRRKYQVLYHG